MIGARVVVSAPVNSEDHCFLNLIGTVEQITTPHGYLRVRPDDSKQWSHVLAHDTVLLHPESVRVLRKADKS